MTNILYIEDDANSRRVLSLLFRVQIKMHHLTIFDDSSDYLSRIRNLTPQPDLILLDIDIRPHSGFDVLRGIRQQEEMTKIQVVAVTASVMTEEVDKLKKAGFDSCLAKPLDPDGFQVDLERILHGEHIWRII